ncbi:ABC transporter ATP-binding protein [Marinomonas algicola]|uniref:ABC transporter ATP-binding protein n=1 Tax=Marinomonas algicola TaxID=2773454 RepID=UPI001EFF4B8A|nr:ABC transporter ATP-binding protein [Marinomonas algicola]
MTMKYLLEVKQVGKAYLDYGTEIRRIISWLTGAQPKQKTSILSDINFSMQKGEAVGLVGENGAGKSTLLKLIVGTLKPTAGTISVNGSVAAILELGMGFNNELTGRQNAYHSATLMGQQHDEILKIMPKIEAFAEIGDYFDQPMRVYSSGMQMRVAFSVATAFRPDLLIIDEALSVGDAYFQHKSFDRIRKIQKEGTSLLIVSHDKEAILRLCDRVILLDQGGVVQDGSPDLVMDYYNATLSSRKNSAVEITQLDNGVVQTSSGTGEAKVKQVSMLDSQGQPVGNLLVGQMVTMRIQLDIHEDLPELVVGYMIKDRIGQTIFGTNTHHLQQPLLELVKGQTLEIDATFAANLGAGSYNVSISLHASDTHLDANYHWLDYALVFEVNNAHEPFFIGTNYLMPAINQKIVSKEINHNSNAFEQECTPQKQPINPVAGDAN